MYFSTPHRALKYIWQAAMEAISALIPRITELGLPNRADLHERLYYSLQVLKKFLSIDGKSLKIEDLENDQYTVSSNCVPCSLD